LVSGTVKEDALYMSSTSKNGTLPGAYKDLLRTATLDILVK
jgi:hypothetical protein